VSDRHYETYASLQEAIDWEGGLDLFLLATAGDVTVPDELKDEWEAMIEAWEEWSLKEIEMVTTIDRRVAEEEDDEWN